MCFIEVYYTFILEAKPHRRKRRGERDKKGKKAFSRTLLKKYSFVFLSSFVSRKLSFEKWLIESYRKDECNERQDFLKSCPCHQIIIFYHSIDIRSDVLSK